MKQYLYNTINILLIGCLLFMLINLSYNQNIIFSFLLGIIFSIFLVVLNKFFNISESKKNDIIIISLFIIFNVIINVLLTRNYLFGIIILIFGIFIYFLLKKNDSVCRAINALILILFCVPFMSALSLYQIIMSFSCILLYYFLDKISLFRKKNMIIVLIIGLLIGFNSYISFINLFMIIIFLLDLVRVNELRQSFKFIFLLVIGTFIGYFSLFLLKINIVESNYLINSSFLNNTIFITILLLLGISTIHTSIFIERKKYIFIHIAIIIAILYSYLFKVDINSYIVIMIIEISNYLANSNLKKYTNIYREFAIKKNVNDIKKVSLVIPNYNYEKYIIERIDSVLLQTYPIYELIILDDKSTDNSVSIINEKIVKIKKEHPNLKVKFIENKKNSGNVFKQWKKAFEEASGDYLWICEADDSCSRIFLQEVMKPFSNPNVIVSYSESLTMDENNKIIMRDLREWIDIFKTRKWDNSFVDTGIDYVKNFMCINNTIANVSSIVFKIVDGIDYEKFLTDAESYKLAGDWYFYEKVLNYGSISYKKESLNYHRMHSNSVTLTTKREKEYEEICKIQNDIINNYPISSEMKIRIHERRVKFQHDFDFSEEEIELSKLDLNNILKDKKINDKILLSIIIPVYNTEAYIEKCLTSVFANLPKYTEVIVVNDGSPDNSEKIIKKFEKKYDSLKYYKKENGGLSNTKNYGLDKANGKYIGFVDSDDYINPNMFDCMLKKAIINDADIVYCDVEMIYENGDRKYVSSTNYSYKDELLQILDTPLMAASWSKIVKKELFKNIDYPDGYNNEDIAVSPILFGRSKNTLHIDTAFYKYLQRSGSIQNSGFNEKRFVAFYTSNLCFQRSKELSISVQEKIKGTIYTNQLLALLLYPIRDIKNKQERLNLIKLFCSYMNEFEDYSENKYVRKYMINLGKEKVLDYIKENNYKKINIEIRKK